MPEEVGWNPKVFDRGPEGHGVHSVVFLFPWFAGFGFVADGLGVVGAKEGEEELFGHDNGFDVVLDFLGNWAGWKYQGCGFSAFFCLEVDF